MHEPFKQVDDSYMHLAKWESMHPSLTTGFTTRNGGYSSSPFQTMNLGLHVPDDKEKVLKNRKSLSSKLDVPLESWVMGEQIHQTNIHIVSEKDGGKGAREYRTSIPATDGLITNTKGILCAAVYADCVPLYFFDPVSEYIGIAHAGWKGTAGRIARKMVQTFKRLGVNKHNLLAAIGPSISGQVYEVDANVIQHIPIENRKNAIKGQGQDRYLLDLRKVNEEMLLEAGIMSQNMEITNYCTFQDEERFFSHRRDKGRSGRMLGYIGFTS